MSVLSRLSLAAGFFHDERFDLWDTLLNDWVTEAFTGRLYVFDRFKTIYHRPTRRETLGIKPGVPSPAGQVIRHSSTGDIFIVTQTERFDADADKVYDRAFALHRPIGLGTLERYDSTGTPPDMGEEVPIHSEPVWYDIELRTDAEDDEAYQSYHGNYFLTMPMSTTVRKGDWILGVDGATYRVDEPYIDGGFRLARAQDVPYPKETFTYLARDLSTGGYDPATGEYTQPQSTGYDFSAQIVKLIHSVAGDERDSHQSDLEIAVDTRTIGFTPEVGYRVIRGRDSRTYRIDEVREGSEADQVLLSLTLIGAG